MRPVQRIPISTPVLTALNHTNNWYPVSTILHTPEVWVHAEHAGLPLCGPELQVSVSRFRIVGSASMPALLVLAAVDEARNYTLHNPIASTDLLHVGYVYLIGGISAVTVMDMLLAASDGHWGRLLRVADNGCMAGHVIGVNVSHLRQSHVCKADNPWLWTQTVSALSLVVHDANLCGEANFDAGTLAFDTRPAIQCVTAPLLGSTYSQLEGSVRDSMGVSPQVSLMTLPGRCSATGSDPSSVWCRAWHPTVNISIQNTTIVSGGSAMDAGIRMSFFDIGPIQMEDYTRLYMLIDNSRVPVCLDMIGGLLQLRGTVLTTCPSGHRLDMMRGVVAVGYI